MNRRGFTLMEILIAGALFSIVMLTATGLFVSTTRSQKRVQSLSKVQGDARFVVETMSQSVRIDGLDYTNMPISSTLASFGLRMVTRDAIGTRTFYRLYQNGTLNGSPRNVVGACTRTSSEDTSNPTKCVPSSLLNTSGYTDITPAGISVTTLSVVISPGSSPFASPPAQATDCKNSAKFDSLKFTCGCDAATVAADCFTDQRCSQSTAGVCLNSNIQPRATLVISSNGGGTTTLDNAAVTFQTTVSSRTYKR